MMAALTELQIAAALCESSYRRNALDQSLTFSEGFSGAVSIDNVEQSVADLAYKNGFYYNNRNFVNFGDSAFN